MVKALTLNPQDISGHWENLKPYIDMALEYSLGEMTAEEVKQVKIVAIKPQSVNEIWLTVESQIQKAIDYTKGEMSTDIIKEKIDSGEYLLLLAVDSGIVASIVCEIAKTPMGNVCHIVACGGSRSDEWLDGWFYSVVNLAKEQDCKRISLSGRKGWEKKLSKYGFKHAYTTLDLDI